MMYSLHIEKDEQGMFVGEIEDLPACYTQAKTLPLLLERMIEVSEWSILLMHDLQHASSPKQFSVSLDIQYASA